MFEIVHLRLPRSTLRCAAILGLATATLAGGFAKPASAEHRDDRHAERRDERRDERREERRFHARHDYQYGGYYRRPGYYYAPPPTVYQPYGYYQQPGASLNFNFPFY